jgi:hypothetical protein
VSSHSPDQPVQRFAEIMAALSDPFANRAAVLSTTGHDAASWASVEHAWTARLAQDTTGELTRAYAEAFSRAAARNDGVQRSPVDPRFLGAAQPFRAEAAAVQLSASSAAPPRLDSRDHEVWPRETTPANRTAEIPCLRRAPVLPFQAPRPEEASGIRRTPAPRRVHEPPIRPPPVAGATTESTMEMPALAPPAAAPPSPRPPGGRLHRFDSQTGAPLPSPFWSEDSTPADPTRSA